ncbi:amylo-alpha-1,6-glucosidase [Scytonema millei]|uniref:Amylo-alpha-1,6-glucosidase n=1 Tax=Scytonema millei VB511283 TaxID=1245923 RepID=A0A9X5E3T8_9CYAN|nr:amylo-alpha-1,6-glucosidase [Scytonema millei]NHC34388.1 amylo-alpha-1,6-glucosidase [Scytonema millei VB511283]
MGNLDTREWLLTNGLGSFACGTVADARTRIYHGWLIAALTPPSQRTLLLSHLDASLEVAAQVFALSTNFWGGGTVEPTGYELLQSFEIEPVPTWVWGADNWQLSRQLIMPDEGAGSREQQPVTNYQSFNHRILIQYQYQGQKAAILRLRPAIADRNFHDSQREDEDLQFSQLVAKSSVCLQAIKSGRVGTLWHLHWTHGDYQPNGVWYWNYLLPEETQRGLSDREDLYSPGYLTVKLKPGTTVTLEAKVGLPESPLSDDDFEKARESQKSKIKSQKSKFSDSLVRADFEQRLIDVSRESFSPVRAGFEQRFVDVSRESFAKPVPTTPDSQLPTPDCAEGSRLDASPPPASRLSQLLLKAGEQFIVYRQSVAGATIIAGYPWLEDFSRDALIALPGLTLSTGRYDLAKELLETLGKYCCCGLMPNYLPDGDREPAYHNVDVSLWWIETLGLYLEASQDWDFLATQYPIVQQIYKAFTTGTNHNIQVDAADELVIWNAADAALTWMDVKIDGQPVTPRQGKPIEVNALWYSALCWASLWAERLSRTPGENVERLSNQARRYTQQAHKVKTSLQKFWNPTLGYLYDAIALDDRLNNQIRPNAILALSLRHCAFSETQGQRILQLATRSLLTPYGLRSLAPNDPEYIGNYAGSPHQRDRAAHQGTVWSWLIGAYVRAWQRFYPAQPLPIDWQHLLFHLQHQACLGSISELFDGDLPHTPRGAIAKASAVAELIRLL